MSRDGPGHSLGGERPADSSPPRPPSTASGGGREGCGEMADAAGDTRAGPPQSDPDLQFPEGIAHIYQLANVGQVTSP